MDTNPDRLAALRRWLDGLAPRFDLSPEGLTPASNDASFRRYFRVPGRDPAQPSLIAMDAPPQHEDCRPFIRVARLFARAGVSVPAVLAENLDEGFLLLTDLGTQTYLSCLDDDRADALYRDALAALLRIQQASQPGILPPYSRELLERELQLFPEWYVTRHLGHALSETQRNDLARVFEAILANNLAQPAVDVHRDYHSRNLMVLATGNPGILDFQDAVHGPITYDLVSLLRDAYIRWDEERVLDWTVRYWEAARKLGLPVKADFGEFWRDFEWMGLQRHLKVLGIFARLYHRDGKDGYLKDLPLVLHHARGVAGRYTPLKPLMRLFEALEGKAVEAGYTF